MYSHERRLVLLEDITEIVANRSVSRTALTHNIDYDRLSVNLGIAVDVVVLCVYAAQSELTH